MPASPDSSMMSSASTINGDTQIFQRIQKTDLAFYTPVLDGNAAHAGKAPNVIVTILSQDQASARRIAIALSTHFRGTIYWYDGEATKKWVMSDFVAFSKPSGYPQDTIVCLHDFRHDTGFSLQEEFAGHPTVPVAPYLVDPRGDNIAGLKISKKAPHSKVKLNNEEKELFTPLLYLELRETALSWEGIGVEHTTFGAKNGHYEPGAAETSAAAAAGKTKTLEAVIEEKYSRSLWTYVLIALPLFIAGLVALVYAGPYLEPYLGFKIDFETLLTPTVEHESVVLAESKELVPLEEHGLSRFVEPTRLLLRETWRHAKEFVVELLHKAGRSVADAGYRAKLFLTPTHRADQELMNKVAELTQSVQAAASARATPTVLLDDVL